MKRILLALTMAASFSAHAADNAVLLSGADLYTVSHGVIAGGELLIRDGKIAALGAHVDAPADARRIELKGKRLYPGYIVANSTLGLTEVEAHLCGHGAGRCGLGALEEVWRAGFGEIRLAAENGGADRGRWRRFADQAADPAR